MCNLIDIPDGPHHTVKAALISIARSKRVSDERQIKSAAIEDTISSFWYIVTEMFSIRASINEAVDASIGTR